MKRIDGLCLDSNSQAEKLKKVYYPTSTGLCLDSNSQAEKLFE